MNFAHNCRLEVQLATACLNYTIIKPRGRHSRAGLCERCQTNDVHDKETLITDTAVGLGRSVRRRPGRIERVTFWLTIGK